MPCQSDYLAPNEFEREGVRAWLVYDEIKTNKRISPKEWASCTDRRAYGNWEFQKKDLDNLTANICKDLSQWSKFSLQAATLELQMWWRDHQKADRAREQREKKQAKDKQLKEEAIAKLTPEERRVLGL